MERKKNMGAKYTLAVLMYSMEQSTARGLKELRTWHASL